MAFRTANPAFNQNFFNTSEVVASPAQAMTVQGTIYKTALLTAMAMATAIFVWYRFYTAFHTPGLTAEQAVSAAISAAMPWMIGGLIGGLVLGLITAFAQKAAPITAPLYALAEGLFLGGVSAFFELKYPGIVAPAIGLTFGTLMVMLMLFTTRIVRVTDKFRAGILMATGAIALLYLATFILGFFSIEIPYIHGSGPIGIGFSVVVVVIAAANLLLDFDFIEKGAEAGLPRHMEWYGAFALLVTLVWLYLEILRLLAKLRDR
jgi:uncharacterized YccA/Bax inhibitor family protein